MLSLARLRSSVCCNSFAVAVSLLAVACGGGETVVTPPGGGGGANNNNQALVVNLSIEPEDVLLEANGAGFVTATVQVARGNNPISEAVDVTVAVESAYLSENQVTGSTAKTLNLSIPAADAGLATIFITSSTPGIDTLSAVAATTNQTSATRRLELAFKGDGFGTAEAGFFEGGAIWLQTVSTQQISLGAVGNRITFSGRAVLGDGTLYSSNPTDVIWTIEGISPSIATPGAWGSFDPKVAEVDNGVFIGEFTSGVATGQFRINATLGDEAVTSVEITIVDLRPSTISLTASDLTMTADGISESIISLDVRDSNGQPVPDCTTISLSLIGTGTLIEPLGTVGCSDFGESGSDADGFVLTRGGAATLYYRAGFGVGPVDIQAAYSERSLVDTVTINLTANPPFAGNIILTADPAASYQGPNATVSLSGWAFQGFLPYAGEDPVTFAITGPTPYQFGVLDPSAVVDVETGLFNAIWRVSPAVGAYTITAFLGNSQQSVVVNVVDRSPASINLTASDQNLVADGIETSNIEATVLDGFGNAVPAGTQVTLAVQAGSGTLEDTLLLTNASGRVSTVFTAGLLGGISIVRASAGGVTDDVSINLAAPPVFAGTIQLAADPSTVLVLGDDVVISGYAFQDGHAYNGPQPITFNVYNVTGSDTGFVSPSVSIDNGEFTASFTPVGDVGRKIIVGYLGTSTGYTFIDVRDTSAASVSVISDDLSLFANGSDTANLTITVEDGFGVPVPDGTNVSLTVFPGGNGSFDSANLQTLGGQAQAVYTAGTTPGSVVITATADGIDGSVTLTLQTLASLFNGTLVLTPVDDYVYQGLNNTVTINGFAIQNGVPYSGEFPVTFTVTGPGAVPGYVESSANVAANGSFSAVYHAATQVGPVTVRGWLGAASGAANVTVTDTSAAEVLVDVDPINAIADGNSNINISATINDALGNPVQNGTSIQLSAPSAAGVLADTQLYTDGGRVQTTLRLSNNEGLYAIVAAAGSVTGVGILNTSGFPAFNGDLSFTLSQNAVLMGAANSVQINGEASENGLAYNGIAPVTFTVTNTTGLSLGFVSPSASVSNGLFTAEYRAAAEPGTNWITARLGNTVSYTLPIRVTDTSADQVVVSASKSSLFANGTDVLTITVNVRDAFAQPVPDGTVVTLSRTPTSGGTLGATSLSTLNGVVSTTLTAGTTAGTTFVTASADGVNGSVSINVQSLATLFNGTLLLAADPTTTHSGLENEIEVSGFAIASNGQPYTGSVPVTFTLTGGVPTFKGTISPSAAVNAADGSFTGTYRASNEIGTFTVTAWLGNQFASVAVGVTDTTPQTINISSDVLNIPGDGVNQAQLSVVVLDGAGSPVPDGTSVTLALSPTTMGTLSATSVLTQGGTAQVVFTSASNVGGTVQIQATSGAATNNLNLNITPVTPFSGDLVIDASADVALSGGVDITINGFAFSNGQAYTGASPVTLEVLHQTGGLTGFVTPSANVSNGAFTGIYTPIADIGTVTVFAYLGNEVTSAAIEITDTRADQVDVSASDSEIVGNGIDQSTISVTVLDGVGGFVPNGTSISFQVLPVTLGTLNPTSALSIGGGATAIFTAANNVAGQATIIASAGSVTDYVRVTVQPKSSLFDGTLLIGANPTTTLKGIQNTVSISGWAIDGFVPYVGTTPVTFTVTGPTGNVPGIMDASANVNANDGSYSAIYRASPQIGTYYINAFLGNQVASVAVAVTDNTPALVSVSASPLNLPADSQSTANIVVTVQDGAGNAVVDGTQVNLSIIGGSGARGTLAQTLLLTDDGQVSTVYTAGTVTGTVTILASADGITSTVNLQLGEVSQFDGFIVMNASPSEVGSGLNNVVTLTGYVFNANNTPYNGSEEVTFSVVGASSEPASTWGIVDSSASIGADGSFTADYLAGTTEMTVTITAYLGVTWYSVDVDLLDKSPASLVIVANPSGLDADATSQATINVTITDKYGQTVANGTSVQFSIVSGSGSLSPIVSTTTNGVAQSTYTAGNVGGTVTIRASAGSISDTTVISLVDISPNTINVSATPTSIEQQDAAYVTATVLDGNNNAVAAGTPVTFYIAPSAARLTTDATITPFSQNTDSNGRATVNFNAGAVTGEHVIIAVYSTASTTITGYTSVSVIQPEIGSIQFVSANPTPIGVKGSDNGGNSALPELSNIQFRVLTASGNDIPDGTVVTFTLNGPPGTSLLTNNAQTIGGIATARIRSGSVAGLARVTARVTFGSNLFIAQSEGVPIQSGPAQDGHVDLVVATADFIKEGAMGTSGLTQSFTVYLGDRFNNPVPDGTPVFFASEAGLITPSATASNGVVTVDLTTSNPRPMPVTDITLSSTLRYLSSNFLSLTAVDPTNHSDPSLRYAPENREVSVAALVYGEERFFDTNADGLYNAPTEVTIDLPEPFLDYNSDGQYSSVITDYDLDVTLAEIYWDSVTENGVYDVGNGEYDTTALLIDRIRVVWTTYTTDFKYLPSQYIDRDSDGIFDAGWDIPVIATFGTLVASAADVVTRCAGSSSGGTAGLVTDGFVSNPVTVANSSTSFASSITIRMWAGESNSGIYPFNGGDISTADAQGFVLTPDSFSIDEGSYYPSGLFFSTVLNQPSAGISTGRLFSVTFKNGQEFVVPNICVIGSN